MFKYTHSTIAHVNNPQNTRRALLIVPRNVNCTGKQMSSYMHVHARNFCGSRSVRVVSYVLLFVC